MKSTPHKKKTKKNKDIPQLRKEDREKIKENGR